MKIAYSQSLADDTTLAPGGLPVSLVNEVIRLEGRIVFNASHCPQYRTYGDRFFSDILPTTALFGADSIANLGIDSIPAENWYIETDGSLHITSGSVLQRFPSATNKEVEIILHFTLSLGSGQCIRTKVPESHAKCYVELQYEVWLKRYNISTGAAQFPVAIDLEFLPIGVRQVGLVVLGIILARNSIKRGGNGFGKWYKCGIYVAESFETYSSIDGDEIIVGMVGNDGSL